MPASEPSSPTCVWSKGLRALLLAEAERFEGVARGYEVVLLEHLLGRRLSEPSLELGWVHVEEQFDQIVVVDFSEDAAGDVAPVSKFGFNGEVRLVEGICVVAGGGEHEIH